MPRSNAAVPALDALSLRPATVADLDALVALEQASFATDRMSRNQYRRHLASRSACVLVAGDAATAVLASAVLFFRAGSSLARLYSLAVAPSARGRGIAGRLLETAMEQARQRGCRRIRLEVRQDNAAAIALYQRHGFTRLVRLPGYYADGGDGWRCQRMLD